MTRHTVDGTIDGTHTADDLDERQPRQRVGLLLAWSRLEPHRVGEVLFVPRGQTAVLGRGGMSLGVGEVQGTFARHRPGGETSTGPIADPSISRRQLLVSHAGGGALSLANEGRAALYVDGRATTADDVQPGATIRLGSRLLLLCVSRPERFPAAPSWPETDTPAFGAADGNGLVGESPLAWLLRDQIGFIARRPHHVLVLGQSGVGKELVARAIHRMSDRGSRSLVSRNAATLPDGLIDAELFGNVRGYPNPGMAERPGIIGAAHRSTLFLDEIGELPDRLQAHLLRVLDAGGEYQRLGDAERRTADLRLIAATNRKLSELRHDLVPRLTLRVSIPGLNARRDDIPLLIAHLLRRATERDAEVARRFGELDGSVRVSPSLVDQLLRYRYTHHVRQLEGFLWRAIATSQGDRIALTPDVEGELETKRADGRSPEAPLPDAETIRTSLARHKGVQARVWKELGLRNRFQLHRLIKKYGIETDA